MRSYVVLYFVGTIGALWYDHALAISLLDLLLNFVDGFDGWMVDGTD